MAIAILERERTAILNSLAAGVVPRVGLQHIQVGRKKEIAALLEDLNQTADGSASVRFVVGRFGAGKSFFLNLVQTVAMEKKFVVARADITTDRRLQGTGGQARSLYSELMRNLSTRSKPDGGALPSLVEKWMGTLEQEIKTAGGDDADVEKQVAEQCKPLQDLVAGFDFVNVLKTYYRGHVGNDDNLKTAAVRWLRAEYPTRTAAREEINVRGIIDDESAYDYLKLMAKFVRIAGYAGLLVCLDELVVLSHRLNNKIARNNNYEAILRILNDCLQGGVEGLGFVFAATDDCLSDTRRGLFSYEALASRLASNRFAGGDTQDLAGPVIPLATLTPEDCYVLLDNIRRVHAGGDATKYVLPDEAITAFLASCQQRMGTAYFQTPRETVKDFVGLLNILKQNPTADWQALIGEIKTTTVQTKDPSESPPVPSTPVAVTTDDDLASFKL